MMKLDVASTQPPGQPRPLAGATQHRARFVPVGLTFDEWLRMLPRWMRKLKPADHGTGDRECRRRRRQIAAGTLKEANGLDPFFGGK